MALAPATISILDGAGTAATWPARVDAAGNKMPVRETEHIGVDTYVYSGTVTAAAMASSTTDLLVLRGSATRTVRVREIRLTGVATAGEADLITIYKHTFANTSGTATTPAAAKMDSGSPAASATFNVYSANPTITAVLLAPVATEFLVLGDSDGGVTAPAIQPLVIRFAKHGDQSLVLRGVAQECAINFGGTKPGSGAIIAYNVVTEEDAS